MNLAPAENSGAGGRPPKRGGYKWSQELTELAQALHGVTGEMLGLFGAVDDETRGVLLRWVNVLRDEEARARDLRTYTD